jgi:sulfate adenylyltransferase subunit 2
MPSQANDTRSLPADALNERRRLAVRLRLSGLSLHAVAEAAQLSVPTVIAAMKAFEKGGWRAVAVGKRGRETGAGRLLSDAQVSEVLGLLDDPASGVWTDERLRAEIEVRFGIEMGSRTLGQYLNDWGIAQTPWRHERAASKAAAFTVVPHELTWVGEVGASCTHRFLVARGRRQELAFVSLGQALGPALSSLAEHFAAAAGTATASSMVCVGGFDVSRIAADALPAGMTLIAVPVAATHTWLGTATVVRAASAQADKNAVGRALRASTSEESIPRTVRETRMKHDTNTLTHLQRLEAESIHILREVVAEADKPVMLYSVGKDSAVMLHLATKAFYPAVPPFPLLHVDTRWKFQEMYRFRDKMAQETGMDLLVHINPEGVEKDINPFTHGSAIHTDIMKTEGLKQALDQYGFDVAFGGARRDEEKSRAKERVFSFRTAQHRWDPKSQRPELWKLYNARKHKGESIRVFPLSNWTELDIWQYIYLENIPIVPLYYSAVRPVVERDGTLIMVDDHRMPLKPGEVPMMKKVRFRTLGCYPLTGAVESEADTLPAIIQEMLLTKTSERQGRVIDHDSAASMEKKKQEGYF